jgi:hypothetical protein
MRSSGEGKGGAGGLTRFFKGQRRRGEEAMAGVLAINGRRAPAAYIALKRGRAIDGGGVTEREVKEGRGGRSSTTP